MKYYRRRELFTIFALLICFLTGLFFQWARAKDPSFFDAIEEAGTETDEEETIYSNTQNNIEIKKIHKSGKQDKININLARAEDFQRLPGVGTSLAKRIIAYRKEHGPFETENDLLKVKGIGGKKFKAIREYIAVK